MSFEEQQAFDKARNTGVALAKLGRWPEAAASYREAIRLCPEDKQVHLNLGFVYYEMGCDADAQQEFERARTLGGLANPPENMRR